MLQDIPKPIRALFEMRDTLYKCRTLPEVLQSCVSATRIHVRAQTASVFLFAKDGLLERVAIDGIDKDGRPIPDNWFREERYELGQSFTGKVAVAVPPSPFGLLRWTSRLAYEDLERSSRELYSRTLGLLTCAAAVPLNGRHRTFGVLEVVNKLGHDRTPVHGMFSKEELYWLALVGMTTSAVVTILREEQEQAILRHISQVITNVFVDQDPQDTYEVIAADLTGVFTSYKACVIRTGSSLDSLNVVAKAGQVSWAGFLDQPLAPGTIEAKVFSSGKSEIVSAVDCGTEQDLSRRWLAANKLRLWACFPLKVKERVLGTVSLFTGYQHVFDDTELSFIESITSLLASLSDAADRQDTINRQMTDDHSRFVSGARLAEHVRFLEDMRHVQKDTLRDLKAAIEDVAPDVGGRARRILQDQIAKIESRLSGTLQEFSSEGVARIRLNDIVQGVTRSFSKELRQKRIALTVSVDKQIPDIEAREIEIRDLLWNLMTNAIKAIESAGRRDGSIAVTTTQNSYERKDVIELTVEDNGIGIRKEVEDKIFQRGFTTYPGGTGFGLFSVQRTVDKYGGKIVLDSVVGKGSKFSVRLPLKRLQID